MLQDIINSISDEENTLMYLVEMGYTIEDASLAIERCGACFSMIAFIYNSNRTYIHLNIYFPVRYFLCCCH